jgi:hypothetical protein
MEYFKSNDTVLLTLALLVLIYGNVDDAVRKCQYVAKCVCVRARARARVCVCVCVCEHLQQVRNILPHKCCCCDNTVLLLLGTHVAALFMVTGDEFIDRLFNMLFAVYLCCVGIVG